MRSRPRMGSRQAFPTRSAWVPCPQAGEITHALSPAPHRTRRGTGWRIGSRTIPAWQRAPGRGAV